MTQTRPLARLRAVLAGLGVVLLTLSAAGAVVLINAQAAHAAAVTITSPATTTGITVNPTLFTGTGTVGDTVTLTGTLLTSSPCSTGVTVDSGGNWACDADFSAPGGATNITATQTGDGSTASGTYDVAFPPTEQLVLTSPGRYATNNANFTVPGTDAISLGTVQGTLTNGVNSYPCFYNTVSGPSFNCVGFTAIPDGDYTLTLNQRIGVATSVNTPPVNIRIDTSGPGTPRITSPYDSSGSNGNAPDTTDPFMPVSGTFLTAGVPEQYATVHVLADVEPGPVSNNNGSGAYCDAITDTSGNWSCTPSSGMTYGDYYGFTVYGQDEAGTTGPSPDPEFGVTVDVPPPVPDFTNELVNQPFLELTGTGVAGGTVHGLFSNGQTCTATVNSGHYECDVMLTPATDGTYTVGFTQTVGAAASTSTSVTVTLDQTPPTSRPTFESPWATGTSPAQDVDTTIPDIRGSADPNAHVIVYAAEDPDGYPANVAPDMPICSTMADNEGEWDCSETTEGLFLGHSYSIGAQQTDQANNPGPGPVATFELTLEFPPQTPTIATPLAGDASGIRAGDPVTFSGTTSPGSTVRVYEGATVLCQSFSSSGNWSCNGAAMSDGSHTVAALAIDHFGVSSDAVARTFTVLPKALAKIPLTFVIGVTDSEGNPLDGAQLTPGETIILWSSGLPTGSTVSAELHSTPYPLGSSTVGDDGMFKLTTQIPLDVEPGDHEFSVTVTPAGDDPTTVTSHTSVSPAAVTPTDAPTEQPQASGAGAPPIGAGPDDGFDSPSTFASTLPTFGSFPVTPTTVAVTGGIALAFLLLVAFPSELLEDTIRENYDRAFGWLTPARRRVDHLRGRFGGMLRNSWAGIALSVLATAVILGFADPTFGFTGASVRLLFGMLISVAVINIGIYLLVLKLAKRSYGLTGVLRSLPGALIIVALSVIVSRVANISPGFLFGVVLAVVYTREPTVAQRAKLVILTTLITIAVGILAWLGYSALRGAHGSGFWYELALEALVAITLEAVGTMIITMLPLTFLDGRSIFRWNRWIWAGIYLLTIAVFAVIVMPISNNWGAMTAPIFGWGTLFVVFAVVAFGTWAVFRFFVRRGEAVSSSSPADEAAPQPQQLQSPPR